MMIVHHPPPLISSHLITEARELGTEDTALTSQEVSLVVGVLKVAKKTAADCMAPWAEVGRWVGR